MDIVIARYAEDMCWLSELDDLGLAPTNIFLYNKGPPIHPDPRYTTIPLDNLGREAHTYLHHVIENYDRLADVTLFLPGSVWTRFDKWSVLYDIAKKLTVKPASYIICHRDKHFLDIDYPFKIDRWAVTNSENRSMNSESQLLPSKIRPLGKWFEHHFSEEFKAVSFYGIVAVSREDIRKRPVEFYKKLLEEVSHKDTEVVHYLERVWKTVFSIDDAHTLSDQGHR